MDFPCNTTIYLMCPTEMKMDMFIFMAQKRMDHAKKGGVFEFRGKR